MYHIWHGFLDIDRGGCDRRNFAWFDWFAYLMVGFEFSQWDPKAHFDRKLNMYNSYQNHIHSHNLNKSHSNRWNYIIQCLNFSLVSFLYYIYSVDDENENSMYIINLVDVCRCALKLMLISIQSHYAFSTIEDAFCKNACFTQSQFIQRVRMWS